MFKGYFLMLRVNFRSICVFVKLIVLDLDVVIFFLEEFLILDVGLLEGYNF